MVGVVVATKMKKEGLDRTGRHDTSERISGFQVSANIVTVRALATGAAIEYMFAIIGGTRFAGGV
jgi:hypothetical protein